MPELEFELVGVESVAYASSPQLAFKLRISATGEDGRPSDIHSVLLRCQIRLEPIQRRYSAEEQERLRELFGEPQRWGQTLRSTLWTNLTAAIPAFSGETALDLIVPCTYDFNVANTKYFGGLDGGEVPLSFLFSGTVFYAGADGGLQVEQISWEKEATFRLPVTVWKQMMEIYYPNCGWLSLRRDVFERLNQYRISHGMATWEQALEALLSQASEPLPAEATP